MLRRLLAVTLVLMLALGLSGVAFAMLVNISQDADYNFAFVGQHGGTRNIVTILQAASGLSNVAMVVQTAPDCEAYVTQTGGVVSFALVEQIDSHNAPTGVKVMDIQTKIRWAIDELAYGNRKIGDLVMCLLDY